MTERGGRADGWSQHERAQRIGWLALTPEQRLTWLEDTLLFATTYLGAATRRADSGATTRVVDEGDRPGE
jgi:hypothetical protein